MDLKIINRDFSLESFYTDNIADLETLSANKFDFSWVCPRLYNKFRDYFNDKGTFLLYHLDR